jgi:DNA segregation ATPase FtsK/SpoIIIE, S-DNA-T family
MARRRKPFGWGRVRLARMRRSARGRAAWLADDLARDDDLPALYRFPEAYQADDLDNDPSDERQTAAAALGAVDPRGRQGSGRGPVPGRSGPDRRPVRNHLRAVPGTVPDKARTRPGRVRDTRPQRTAPVPDPDADRPPAGPHDDGGPGVGGTVVLDRPAGPVVVDDDAETAGAIRPAGGGSGAGGNGGAGPVGGDAENWDDDPDNDDHLENPGTAGRRPGGRSRVAVADQGVDGWGRHGQPLVPGWMRHPLQTGRRVLVAWWHEVMFQTLRSPSYALRWLRWAPRGLVRVTARLARWAADAEGRELRWLAVAREDAREYLHLSRQRNARVRNRVPAAVVLAVTVAGLTTVGLVWPALVPWLLGLVGLPAPHPWLVRISTAVAVLVGLARVGAPADRPMVDHAVVPPQAKRITPDLIEFGFASAKLCSLDDERAPGRLRFASPVAQDGPGVRALVDLPPGVTASQALGAREKIAAGMEIDEFRVFLTRQRGSAGSARRVVLWVADRDPYEATSPVSALAHARQWDLWRGLPFGRDHRGKQVVLPLVWTSLLIGSIPRMGKTNALRIVTAAAALDPHVRLLCADGKGGKDLKPLEQAAHFYAAGVREAVVAGLVEVLRDAVEDMNRRYEVMQDLPDDVCPEGKVTPYITRRRSYAMPLVVIAIDEVHRYLEHAAHGATIRALLVELAKAGPAAGYMLVLATQRPDAKVIPDDLRGQIGTRFALRVMTWQTSDTILGAGSYSAGLDASQFLAGHKGVGILRGVSDDTDLADTEAVTVRTDRLGIPDLRRIGKRGRELRISAGTLTGTAAGEDLVADAPARRLLDDILDVFEPAEDRAWSETLVARLARRWPDTYDGWDPKQLAGALRPLGVETGQVWQRLDNGQGANRRGVTRQGLLDAIATREDRTIDATATEQTGIPGPQQPPPGPGRPLATERPLADDPASSSSTASDPDQGPSG